MVAPSEAIRSLVDVEHAASKIARARFGGKNIPLPTDPTIDDAEGNLSVRFTNAGGNERGYDSDLLEVWLDRSGKLLVADAYQHFNCIAQGTPIATPRGAVAVEQLGPGSEVIAYDVESGARSVAKVERIVRGSATSVLEMGDLRVTAEHPIWAGSAWRRAGDVEAGEPLLGDGGAPLVAAPRLVSLPHVVFDISVGSPHTFFAGGVLVHNKAVPVPLAGDRPWGALFFRRAAK